MEDGGWRMQDGGWRIEDEGWRMEDGGWRKEDGGQGGRRKEKGGGAGSEELGARGWKPGEAVGKYMAPTVGRLTWALGMKLFNLLDTAVSAVL